MIRYLWARFVQMLVVVFLAVTLNFAIPRMIPGDPIELALGRLQQSLGADGLDVNRVAAEYRSKYGLDRGVGEQFVAYWADLLRGDLGYSLASLNQPVMAKIGAALPWTVGLLGTATLVAFLLGTTLGALMAWPRTARVARLLGAPFIVVAAVPKYIVAVVLVATFAVMLRWLPAAGGMSSVTVAEADLATVLDILRHAILPATALVLGTLGFWAMGMRANMVGVIGSDQMLFAEAKGLGALTLFFRYGIRNALLPQVTALALALGSIISGAVLVEIVFNYPGLGGLLYSAVTTKDYFVIQGITLFLVVATAVSLFVVDLLLPLIDPRVTIR